MYSDNFNPRYLQKDFTLVFMQYIIPLLFLLSFKLYLEAKDENREIKSLN